MFNHFKGKLLMKYKIILVALIFTKSIINAQEKIFVAPDVNIISVTPVQGIGIDSTRVPSNVQNFSDSILRDKKNFSIGGLIIMILSIPVIIFGVNVVNVSNNIEIIKAQINILLGIMFFFLAISPWASGLCLRISLQNK